MGASLLAVAKSIYYCVTQKEQSNVCNFLTFVVIFHSPLKMLRPFEKSYSLLTEYIFTQTLRVLHSMTIIKLNRHTSWDKVEQHLTGWFSYIFH